MIITTMEFETSGRQSILRCIRRCCRYLYTLPRKVLIDVHKFGHQLTAGI